MTDIIPVILAVLVFVSVFCIPYMAYKLTGWRDRYRIRALREKGREREWRR